MKLALFGGIATRAYADKIIREAEEKLNFVASETKNVVIAWKGTPLDGHTGVIAGSTTDGKSLVRLDATGGVFPVPGQFLVAAPKAKEKKSKEEKEKESRKPDPSSRGSAPKAEEMTERAKAETVTTTEAPAKLERTKPQALPIEQARTAPEAGSPIQALVDHILNIENEKAAAISKLNKFKEGLNLDLIDENYKKKVKELHDAIEATGEPVLKLKDKFLATDVKRDVVEANMSDETRRKFNALVEKLSAKEAEMAKLDEQIEELVNASFARMGGTEKVQERVTMFEEKGKKPVAPASLIEVLSVLRPGAGHQLTSDQKARLQRLEAGLKEMFNAVVDKAKEFAKGLGDIFNSGMDFLKSYERDAKAAEKAQPAMVEAADKTKMEVVDKEAAPMGAKRGAAAMKGWMSGGGSKVADSGEPQTALGDCFTDLLHYANQNGLDGLGAMETAKMHFQAETEGEPVIQGSVRAGSRIFDVFLNGEEIDTVFYSPGANVDVDEVKRSLINHDGYDPGIVVKERKSKPKIKAD